MEEAADEVKTASSSGKKVVSKRVPTAQHNADNPTSQNLAQSPPNAAFKKIAHTCRDCHQESQQKNSRLAMRLNRHLMGHTNFFRLSVRPWINILPADNY